MFSVGTELEALLPEYASRLSRKVVTVCELFEEYERHSSGGWLEYQ